MRGDSLPGCFVLVLCVAALFGAAASSAASQRGDGRACPDAPQALILARLTWHEAGVDSLADASAIYESLTGLAQVRGETWEEAACAYSGRALRGETRRSWISRLDGVEIAPDGWPGRLSWGRQGPLFGRLLEHADRIVAGDVARACEALPTDWGDPDLDSHRIARGLARGYWRRLSCPHARNVYLRRVQLDRLDAELLEIAGGR